MTMPHRIPHPEENTCTETILTIHLRPALYFAFPNVGYIKGYLDQNYVRHTSDQFINASLLRVGFMHMPSIVQMPYLSRKSLSITCIETSITGRGGRTYWSGGLIADGGRDEPRSLDIQVPKNFLGVDRQSPQIYDVRQCTQSQHSHSCGVLVRREESEI
jgi:hypothetical protein